MGGSSSGGSSDPVRYYIRAEEQVVCSAPIDEILSIRVNDSIAYKGFADDSNVVNTNSLENGKVYKLNNNKSIKFDLTSLFGGKDSEGGISGWCDFRFGYDNQEKSRSLYNRVGNVILGATRGVVSMVMKDFYTGISPYAKAWHFRVKSTQKKDNYQTNWYVEKASIYHGNMSQEITVNNHIASDQYTRYSLCNAKETPTAIKGFVINDSTGYKGEVPNQESLTINYYDVNLNSTNNSFRFKNDARYYQTIHQGYQPAKTALPAKNFTINVAKVLETDTYIDLNGRIAKYNEVVATDSPNVTNPQTQRVQYSNVSYDAFTKALIYVNSSNTTIYDDSGSGDIRMRLPYKTDSNVVGVIYGAPTITEVDTYQSYSESIYSTSPNNICVCASGNSVYYVDNTWTIFKIKRYYYGGREEINITHLLHDARKILAINVDDTSEYITVVYAKRSSYDIGNDVFMAYGDRSVLINEINLSSLYGIRYDFHSTNTGWSPTGVAGDFYNAYFVNVKGGTAFVYDNHYFNLTMPSTIMLNDTQVDYNPAHAIYEIITNKVWGLGKDPSCIDEANFKAVADTLYNEQLGISFTYETSEKISELLQSILDIIGGVLRLNRTTGLLELKLIRGDYTKSDLPIFDYSNISEITDVSRTALSECINQVTLKYTDWETGDTASYVIQDLGLLQQTGEVNNSDITYKYIHWAETAQKIALRELCDASSQFLGCEITTNSDGRNVNLGDCIVVNFPKFKISNTVFRVNKISYGSSSDLTVKMTLIQDKYDYPTTEAYVPPQGDSGGGSPVIESTTIIRYWDIMETPYYMLYKKYGLATLEERILINPFISKISPLVSKYKASGVEEIKGMYSVDYGSTFLEADGNIDASLSCVATYNVGLTTTTISYSNGYGMSKVDNSYFAIINNEIMVVANNETLTNTITVGRGCLDTVPQKHPAGSVIYFVKRDNVPIMNEEFVNQDVSIRCYGAYGSTLDLAQNGEKSISLDVRALKPYNIANIKINDVSFGTDYTSLDYRVGNTLKITFSTRNRMYQIGDEILDWFNDENISLEEDCVIKLDWVVNNETVHTDTLLDDVNYVHVPLEVDGNKVTLRFYTEVDGVQCYQPFEQEINIKQDTNYVDLQIRDGELISYTDSDAQFDFMLDDGELKYTINSILDSELSFEKQDDDIVKIIDIGE